MSRLSNTCILCEMGAFFKFAWHKVPEENRWIKMSPVNCYAGSGILLGLLAAELMLNVYPASQISKLFK